MEKHHHPLLKLEAKVSHGGANMLLVKYLGTRDDQGKVVMELLYYAGKG